MHGNVSAWEAGSCDDWQSGFIGSERLNIDWQKVCLNLRTHYASLSTVAKVVNSDWRHLNRLARGETHQPRFDTGMRLLDLHYDKCPQLHNKNNICF